MRVGSFTTNRHRHDVSRRGPRGPTPREPLTGCTEASGNWGSLRAKFNFQEQEHPVQANCPGNTSESLIGRQERVGVPAVTASTSSMLGRRRSGLDQALTRGLRRRVPASNGRAPSNTQEAALAWNFSTATPQAAALAKASAHYDLVVVGSGPAAQVTGVLDVDKWTNNRNFLRQTQQAAYS